MHALGPARPGPAPGERPVECARSGMPLQKACVCVCASTNLANSQGHDNVKHVTWPYIQVCAGLCELPNVQGWDLVHGTDSQSNGEQLVQPGHRHSHGLKKVAPGNGQPWPGLWTTRDFTQPWPRQVTSTAIYILGQGSHCMHEIQEPSPIGSMAMSRSCLA